MEKLPYFLKSWYLLDSFFFVKSEKISSPKLDFFLLLRREPVSLNCLMISVTIFKFWNLAESPFPVEEEDLQFVLTEKMQIIPDWERVTHMEGTWQF